MMLPTSVILAVEDPKYASFGALESAVSYQDYLRDDDLEMVTEELTRRGWEGC